MVSDRAASTPAWWVLRAGGFRRLWFAQVVAGLGDWLAVLAVIEFAARVTEPSEVGISVVMAIRMVAGLVFAPVAGALADRWDRRRTMVGCHTGRAALLAIVPVTDSLA